MKWLNGSGERLFYMQLPIRILGTLTLGLAGIHLLASCKPDSDSGTSDVQELTDDARRIMDSQNWGEEEAARQEAERRSTASVAIAIPADLPSPELLETTQGIYARLKEKAGDYEALASTPEGQKQSMQPYSEVIPAADGASLDMVPVSSGTFTMGSPVGEVLRKADEGPERRVYVDGFWMSTIEIPWEIYTAFMENGRPRSKAGVLLEERPDDELWDAVTQPTAPYTAMNLGMGHGYEKGMPAIAMSHYAASKFCEWLSAQTGHYYRLPTEAEWEYACRAGSKTAYCYGNDESSLDDYAWYWNNSDDRYQKVASKKPNAWGLYDMHGNVAEWTLDTYLPDRPRSQAGETLRNPLVLLPAQPGHVVKGGSWDDDPDKLRSAARVKSNPDWNMQDPQNPKSIWYLTDGGMIGFRVVRPTTLPDVITVHRLWNSSKGIP